MKNKILIAALLPLLLVVGCSAPPAQTVETTRTITETKTETRDVTAPAATATKTIETTVTEPAVTVTTTKTHVVTATPTEEPEPTQQPEPPQTSRTNPAGLNETVLINEDNWLDGKIKIELEMLQIISGNQAWEMIEEWNMFNEEPKEGKEYILVKFRVKTLELEEEPYSINHAQFGLYSSTGVEYTDFYSVAGMDPDLSTKLYEGAEHAGYTAFLVNAEDSPVAVYGHLWGENAAWFDLRAS